MFERPPKPNEASVQAIACGDEALAALLRRTDALAVERTRHILDDVAADDPARAFLYAEWRPRLVEIREKSSGNKVGTAVLAWIRLFFVVPLPALTGLSAIVGSNTSWLRWTIFGVTVFAAILSQLIVIQAYEPRWMLYQSYSELFFEAGRLYVERVGPYDPALVASEVDTPTALKNLFVANVTKLLNDLNQAYGTVVHAANGGPAPAGAATKA